MRKAVEDGDLLRRKEWPSRGCILDTVPYFFDVDTHLCARDSKEGQASRVRDIEAEGFLPRHGFQGRFAVGIIAKTQPVRRRAQVAPENVSQYAPGDNKVAAVALKVKAPRPLDLAGIKSLLQAVDGSLPAVPTWPARYAPRQPLTSGQPAQAATTDPVDPRSRFPPRGVPHRQWRNARICGNYSVNDQ